MSKYLKKFATEAEYNAYRANDGWYYPNVSLICSEDGNNNLHYNNEFCMRWYDADVAKTPVFYGDVSHTEFKSWVDNASWACECMKGTGAPDGDSTATTSHYGSSTQKCTFVDYFKHSGSTVTSWSLLSDGTTSSHYTRDSSLNTVSDNADSTRQYLQMAEISNINVGLFQNEEDGWKEIRFQFDPGLPTSNGSSFHKWFSNPYWNSTRACYTKLLGRYDPTPTYTYSNGFTTTNRVDCACGLSQSPSGTVGTTYDLGNWSANTMLTKTKATGSNLQVQTYWEWLVMSYIYFSYYKTFNSSTSHMGLVSGYTTGNAGDWKNGQTDSNMTHYSPINTSVAGYRFLHLENPLHGKQWIWAAGTLINNGLGVYYLTLDADTANLAATLSTSNASVNGVLTAPSSTGYSWISNRDLYGMPTEFNGSSSTGFYDGVYRYTGNGTVAYVGGYSFDSSYAGLSALFVTASAAYSYWNRRFRVAMYR